MELQFEKTVTPCLRTVTREMQAQELTQEVRLTDGMPDIGKVLGSWGQVLIRGKQWNNGIAGTNGGVMVTVLYMPEEGEEPQSVEAWIPFQFKWDVSSARRDGNLCIQPFLRGIDARSVSARKLLVRAGLGMLGHACVSGEAQTYTPENIPEDVQLLKNTYPVQVPTEAGEKPFFFEEILTIPGSAPEFGRLIRYGIRPELLDKKVVADKVIMRGSCAVNMLYCGTDGKLYSWDADVPFSQYAQLDKEYDTTADGDITIAVTDLEIEQVDGGLKMKAGLNGQYTIFDRVIMDVTEDAYSPYRNMKVQTERSDMPTVLDAFKQTISADKKVDTGSQRVVDIAVYIDQPAISRGDHKMSADISGTFQLLSYDHEGQLQCAVSHWQNDWSLPVDCHSQVDFMVQQTGKPQGVISGGSVDVCTDMLVKGMVWADHDMELVTGLEFGELQEPDPNRPSLVLRRAGEERLWDIAKDTGSTVDAIMQANSLQHEPDSEQMLLIPIS